MPEPVLPQPQLPIMDNVPDANGPHKKPFSPSTSSSRPFDRSDSRGSYQLAAAPPQDVGSALSSIGYKARHSINKGYNTGVAALTAETASLPGSQQNIWKRTVSAPSYGRELQPFGQLPAESSSSSSRTNQDAIMEEGEMMDDDGAAADGGFSPTLQSGGGFDFNAPLKRDLDDALGAAFAQDEEDEEEADETADAVMMMVGGANNEVGAPDPFAARQIRPIPSTSSTASSNVFVPRQRTFKTAQTLPVAFTADQAQRSRDRPLDQFDQAEEKWRAVDFSKAARETDF